MPKTDDSTNDRLQRVARAIAGGLIRSGDIGSAYRDRTEDLITSVPELRALVEELAETRMDRGFLLSCLRSGERVERGHCDGCNALLDRLDKQEPTR